MKLAEALIKRADHQKRIEHLKKRLLNNAKVQEGDKPAEKPETLLAEMEELSGKLTQLIQQINKTNSTTKFQDDLTIADAIALRDILKLRYTIYRELAQAATITQQRYSKSEVKFQSTVNVAEIQNKADDLAKEIRELDAKIQAQNWQIDLV